MKAIKLIKKPIGKTKIEFYVTVDGASVNDAIDASLEIITKTSYAFVSDEDDAESVLRKQLGDQQFEMLLSNHVMGRLSPYIINSEADMNMAFEPQCTCESMPKRDEEFTFTIHVLLKPKYELTSYDPVEVTIPRYKVPEEAIDKQIEQIAEMNTSYKRIDDASKPVEMGSFVQIDMQTTKDGEEIPGLCGTGRLLELTYGYMPKEFIDGIVGMKVGETKNFDFEGPKENTMDEENTETYNVTVTITELKRKIIPSITNAWVEVNMPEAGNVEGLRNMIRENLEQQAEAQSQQDMSALVDIELAKRFKGKISDEIYETAASSIYQNMSASLRQQGMTIEQMMEQQGMNREQLNLQIMLQARDMIRQGFALDKLYEEKIGEITDEDLEEAYKAFAPGQEEEAKKQFQETGRLYAVREVAKRLKAHRWLLETAKVTREDVEVSAPQEQQ